MIPVAILLGLIGGLIPRYRWWSIPAIGVYWSIQLSAVGDPTLSLAQIWIGGFAFGALNGAVGVLATWGSIRVMSELAGRVRSRSAPR
jgi:hypothetical protein